MPVARGLHGHHLDGRPFASQRLFPTGQLHSFGQAIGGQHLPALLGRNVKLCGVFAHHAVGIENRRQLAHAVFHSRDPLARQIVGTAAVKQRDDLLLQNVVQGLALQLILVSRIRIRLAAADGPADIRAVRLDPPPVEDRTVEHAIDRRLHAAGAGCLVRPPRRIEPDVYALHQHSGNVDVVIFHEDDAPPHGTIAGEIENRADQLLAFVVGWVGLAGEDELHRMLRVLDQRRDPPNVAQDQRSALVGGEAAGKTDSQGLGVE